MEWKKRDDSELASFFAVDNTTVCSVYAATSINLAKIWWWQIVDNDQVIFSDDVKTDGMFATADEAKADLERWLEERKA